MIFENATSPKERKKRGRSKSWVNWVRGDAQETRERPMQYTYWVRLPRISSQSKVRCQVNVGRKTKESLMVSSLSKWKRQGVEEGSRRLGESAMGMGVGRSGFAGRLMDVFR